MEAKLAPQGYDPKKLIDTIWCGTGAMVKNDGTKANADISVYPHGNFDDLKNFLNTI